MENKCLRLKTTEILLCFIFLEFKLFTYATWFMLIQAKYDQCTGNSSEFILASIKYKYSAQHNNIIEKSLNFQ